MRIVAAFLLLCCLSLSISLSVTAQSIAFPTIDPQPMAEWTILAYYGGDNDLENHILNDVNEFELSGASDATTRVIVLLDRSPENYTSPTDDWNGTRLYEIAADQPDSTSIYPPTLNSTLIADLGNLNTGDSQTLTEFLKWGVTHYPAKRYAIAFSSHGAAWAGIVTDTTSRDILTLPEMQTALKTATETAGVAQFDLLINDACLMSSVEYYSAVAPYFNSTIGSPELVISPALDMTALTDALRADPGLDLTQLSYQLINEYITEIAPEKARALSTYFTNAYTDLTAFNEVQQSLEAFAALINSDPARYVVPLARARSAAYTYTRFSGSSINVDLGDLMNQIVIQSRDDLLVAAASEVLVDLDVIQLYGKAGIIAAERVLYYNVYFPERQSDLSSQYLQEGILPEWSRMLQTYFTTLTQAADNATLQFHPALPPQVMITGQSAETARFDQGLSFAVETVGNNITGGSFRVWQMQADGTGVLVNQEPLLELVSPAEGGIFEGKNQWDPGVDERVIQWMPRGFALQDTSQPIPVTLSPDGQDTYFIDGRYRNNPNETWREINVTLSITLNRLTTETVVSRDSSTGSLAVVQLDPTAEVQLRQTILKADGTTENTFGPSIVWGDRGLVLDEVMLASGAYQLVIEVEGFGGSLQNDTITVQVENDDLQAGVRGQNFAEQYGFILPVPATWSADLVTDNVFVGFRSQPLPPDVPYSANIQYGAYYYRNSSEDLDVIANYTIRFFNATVTEEPVSATIDERSVREYRFALGNGALGRLFAVYDPDRKLGLNFTVFSTNPEDTAESIDGLYQVMRDGVRFFMPSELISSNQWRMLPLTTDVSFPMLIDWGLGSFVQNWQSFPAPGLSGVFAAVRQLPFDPTTQTASSALDALLTENRITRGVTRATYDNAGLRWEVASYTRGSRVGRLYVTAHETTVYALRFETNRDDAPSHFADWFEPMVNGFTIITNRFVRSTFDGFGVSFERPNPILDGGWTVNLFDDPQQRINYIDTRRARIIEVYLTPEASEDLNAIAESVTRTGMMIVGEPAEITLDGQPALEFEATMTQNGDVWQGRYFAIYQETRGLGLVIGVRAIEGITTFEPIYARLRATITLSEGPYYPFNTLEQKYSGLSIAKQFGVATVMPLAWQPINVQDQGAYTFIYTGTRQRRTAVNVIQNAPNDLAQILEILVAADGNAHREPRENWVSREITVDGRPALEIEYDGGMMFVIYDEERRNGHVVEAYLRPGSKDAGLDYRLIYEEMRSNFRILPLTE
ncbi:MAG: clostripain-related cysteine peptidase [Anaerolineae bacterium]|nr:clostripain-related cysteine peptidase [Anaerolineae bacterium]